MTRSPTAVPLRADYSARPARKRAKLEADRARLTEAWCKHLTALADTRNYLARLKDAPSSEWASNERAEVLTRMRHHEVTASALDTLLRGVERDIALIDAHQETMATARGHLARRWRR
jgi:uncharacterized protein with PIN domain